ncbi:MAG: glycosyltransferase family 4 protein [Nitrospirae bacterium]|nr:glycosyltransferase family 4 protein [Nitrospirota bacterium]
MKIIHVEDYYQPQLGYQEPFLAREHSRLGHDVHVITSDRYYPFPSYESTAAPLLGSRRVGVGVRQEADGVSVHRLPVRFEGWHRIWLKGLLHEVEDIRPDVVFAHGVESITALRLAGWKLTKKPTCKLIYDCHTLEIQRRSRLSPLFGVAYKRLLKYPILRAGDGFVAVSSTTKEYMETRYGLPSNRIQVIQLGGDTDAFRRNPSCGAQTRSRLGIAPDEVVFIYVGKVIPEKGVHLLAAAARQLVKECPHEKVRVLVVGGGPSAYRARIEAVLQAAGIGEAFVWTGLVPNAELPQYYSAANVGVWPCEVTITQWEAMACELPIIVGDNPAAAERVAWNNGLAYSEGDAEDLCRAMKTLLADESLRREMGRRGRDAVERWFSWRGIATRFIELADG